MLNPGGIPSSMLNLIYFKTILFLPNFPILFEMMMYDSIVYAPDITFNFPTAHTQILHAIGNTEVPASPKARGQMMLYIRNFYLNRVGWHMCTLLNVKLWGVCMPSSVLNVMDGGPTPPKTFGMHMCPPQC